MLVRFRPFLLMIALVLAAMALTPAKASAQQYDYGDYCAAFGDYCASSSINSNGLISVVGDIVDAGIHAADYCCEVNSQEWLDEMAMTVDDLIRNAYGTVGEAVGWNLYALRFWFWDLDQNILYFLGGSSYYYTWEDFWTTINPG